MKVIVFIFSMMILSCYSQKQVIKENETIKEDVTIVKEKSIEKDSIRNISEILENAIRNDKIVKNENNVANQENTNVTLLTEGTHGGFNDAQTLVIKDQKGLQKIYTQINMTRRPGLPIPKIDFEKEMVIALFMGEKNSGGYSAKVESVKEKGKEFEIVVKETAPEGVTTTVICQPFYFCKVKRNDGQIVFKKAE